VIDLLDDLFEKACLVDDEPIEQNFIKKHYLQLIDKKIDRPTSRLFSNPAGDFGSMVNEQIGSGDWTNSSELGKTWENRNSFSYGKKNEKGTPRPELLQNLLNTTERIIQEIDCVEYGLTDIQEYYSNTGALKKAAENNRKGKKVSVSIVEAFEKNIKPKDLEETLRMEYRTKLLNPKWSDAMIKQGSSGLLFLLLLFLLLLILLFL
jgi:magnesium chelatase subunit H